MITRSPDAKQSENSWQQQLANAVTCPDQLLNLLELDPGRFAVSKTAAKLFRLRVPHSFISRMRRGDQHDPLLRQVLPIDEELRIQPGYSKDPLAEATAMPVPGLLHKYQGRALLTVTGACAIHCRYCFRRHFPYTEANPSQDDWQQTLAWLASQTDIHEIILSGGDPLSLADSRLDQLIRRLEAIPHLKRLRIHSRLAVVLPARITPTLVEQLSDCRMKVVLVTHINHASEIDAEVNTAMDRLSAAGITLLNQAVLLKGVNDTATTLAELSEALFEASTLPYYLHQLDPVQGAAHFSVGDKTALQLMDALRTRLPGYLLPRLVREQAGKLSKSALPTLEITT